MALKVAILLPLAAALKVSTGPPAREMAPTLPKAMEMAGIGLETGGQIWDPAGFATFSDESLTWFRACELKHGRVAMLASAGWMANGLHLAWPGTIDYTTPFSDLAALPPFEAWEKVPLGGKLQILAWAFCVELYSEMQKPHYLKGGDFVTYDWAKQADGKSPAELLRKQNAELKNGRLAMIGILGFFASANIPGAVPMVPH
ncbi:hypothetical protein AURANDRAFT_39474 [Aureococcus anophagefferens]|uniref:Uncharacterized protein LHC60 n=1 Tax=Aureococcus anophagefferens TaxID=44056 RepID=F0YPE8_AURAN|nr:hypothetical protein AURANDRAFT_39474 [Aureococcus anophagefferens]EGB03011.1 hypothetical protein AURANDRAFT_39474 [Aureococcus anophagefferens]|eukprot:XP_009042289.1 hypothetical protein AURANDRAFT_39474 [Aureococcus anophagefferens]